MYCKIDSGKGKWKAHHFEGLEGTETSKCWLTMVERMRTNQGSLGTRRRVLCQCKERSKEPSINSDRTENY